MKSKRDFFKTCFLTSDVILVFTVLTGMGQGEGQGQVAGFGRMVPGTPGPGDAAQEQL